MTSTAGEFGNQRLAQFAPAAAAVPGEVEHEIAQSGDVRALDHPPAVFFGLDQSGPDKNSEMRRKGALVQSRRIDEQAMRFGADEALKGLQPRRVGQGGKGAKGIFNLNSSYKPDGLDFVNTNRHIPMLSAERLLYRGRTTRNPR